MSQKVLLVGFNGEAMCFVHVLLNALDMQEKGYDVKVMIEGSATLLANELNDETKPFGPLYIQVRDEGLIDCVCKACAAKMGALESVQEQGLSVRGDMKGHPALAEYIQDGYQIVTF